TRKLAQGTADAAEVNSQLTLEDASGAVLYYFQEMPNGIYIVPGMNLDLNNKYKLHIATTDGKQYLSDDIEVKQTPPIDSVNWQRQDNGVMIYVNTHDSQDKTKYYRWDYINTWEYHSHYFSSFKYDAPNNSVLLRGPDDNIFQCWTTKNSTDLLLGSSAKLSHDVISMNPIRFIATNSIELSVKYSILVRQYALTKEGYDYFQNLKKITEQLGSIFDAQPSQVTGNIHVVGNPDEPVLGFVTASTVEEKRIFIDKLEVLPWFYQVFCDPQIIIPLDSLKEYFGNGLYIPVSQYSPAGAVVGYYSGTSECVDCRIGAGVNVKPSFWP
ncbi:MAG: DUF4249 domain-containing protein, partial [Bacteroidota bacterium]